MDDGGPVGRGRAAREAVAWLASPVTVAGVVLLAVNDHVLKQAHPGVVTGKVSDVVGLLVAPPLLALLLALAGVPRARDTALVATGTGFGLVKLWQPATDVANDAWRLTGDWATTILRDPTDLVALPALLLAAWVSRHASRPRTVRSRARLAVGALVLPFAVLSTAATSCSTPSGETQVSLVRGDFTGGVDGVESRLLLGDVTLAADGTWSALSDGDQERLRDEQGDGVGQMGGPAQLDEVCTQAAPRRTCWRASGTRVEMQVDGRAAELDYALPPDVVAALHDEFDNDCGAADVGIVDVAVLETPAGPVVVAAAGVAGYLVRDADGRWTRDPAGLLAPSPAPSAGVDVPVGALSYRDVPAPGTTGPAGSTSGSTSGSTPGSTPGPTPPDPSGPVPCPDPTTVRVTPHPSNGPPTDLVGCPP